MIQLTRLNGTDLWLNPLLIESVERTPDSIVTLTNGHKYVIREAPDAIIERTANFYRQIGLIGTDPRKEAGHK